jgi:glycopeptide antibiotics resistance protein
MKLSRAHIPAILWTLLIGSSCLISASAFKDFSFDSLLQIDKVIHLTLYFFFVLFWALSIPHTKWNTLALLATGILYGILIEVLQGAMHLGRSYDIDDIIANTVGAILGALCIGFVKRKMPFIKKYLPFASYLY